MKKTVLYALLFVCAVSTVVAQNELFSEDFDGALPTDWTTEELRGNASATSNWMWTDVGPTGPFAGGQAALDSETADNGWMIFDSDLNCSGEQDVRLITPAINTMGSDKVFIEFQSWYRRFNDTTSIEVSTNMTDWTPFPVFSDFVNNQLVDENPTFVRVDISAAAANQPAVYIALRFLSDPGTVQAGTDVGCAYSWQVDDVRVVDDNPTPPNDMRANDNWFAIAPNYATPKSQVEPMGFMSDIENIGSDDQTGVNLNVSIEDANSGSTIFTADFDYGTVAAGALIENMIFPETFTPPDADTSTYIGTYTLTQDQEESDPTDNSLSFRFAVTDSVFSKENGRSITGAFATTQFWSYGNYYYMPNGEGYKATTVRFGIDNSDVFIGELQVALYEWDDMNGDSTSQDTERMQIAESVPHIVLPGDTVLQLGLIPTDGSDDVLLKDDTHYLTVVHTKPLNDETAGLLASTAFDYAPMQFVTGAADNPQTQRFGSFFASGNNNDDLEGRDFTPSNAFAAVIRLHIQPLVSSTNDLADRVQLQMYPNPVSDELTIDLAFDEVVDAVSLEIQSVSGKIALTRRIVGTPQSSETLDVSKLPEGSYILTVRTRDGHTSKRFVIHR